MRRPTPGWIDRPRLPLALLLGLVGVLVVLMQADVRSGLVAAFLLLASGIALGLQPLLFTRGRSDSRTIDEDSSDDQPAESRTGGSPFDLRTTLTEVVLAHAPSAEAAGLGLTLHIDRGLPGTFLGEAEPIAAVLGSLVANALAATERGAVRVAVSRPEPASGCTVAIEVEDTGVGISADRLAAVFEFTSERRHSDTLELGVADRGPARCREVVEALGGSLRVRSKVGCGSTFRVELPLLPEPGAALPSRATALSPEPLVA